MMVFHLILKNQFGLPIRVAQEIQKKLRKNYQTEFKVELLVYYELQPEFPVEYWFEPELDTVVDCLKESTFQKIWLFSMTQKKIMIDCEVPH